MNGKARARETSSLPITGGISPKGLSPNAAIERMRCAHNKADGPTKSWSYGPTYREGRLRCFEPEDARLQRRKLDGMWFQHLSRPEIFPIVTAR